MRQLQLCRAPRMKSRVSGRATVRRNLGCVWTEDGDRCAAPTAACGVCPCALMSATVCRAYVALYYSVSISFLVFWKMRIASKYVVATSNMPNAIAHRGGGSRSASGKWRGINQDRFIEDSRLSIFQVA